ncbi:quinone oxidoreductase family protein [Rhizobium sp. LEGMi135b]
MARYSQTIRFSEFGAPEVMRFESIELQAPKAGEVQIEHLAIGVNYIDVYHRKGVFAPQLSLPSSLGVEGVGLVTEVGEGVSNFKVGDRVAYVGGPQNAYSTHRNLPAARALSVPDTLDSAMVAALIFKGLTAEYLIHRCVPVAEGDTVLFHAAAGGVGSIATQWLRHIGATVIGTVSSEIKAKVALANGANHAIIYTKNDFRDEVAQITAGKGVRVVYDSVGADTFAKSLDCLHPRGTLVSFGEASGPIEPLAVGSLGGKGSLFVTRPSIAHYTADRGEYETAAQNLFKAIEAGIVKAPNVSMYKLSDAVIAHQDLEARRTHGSVILIP